MTDEAQREKPNMHRRTFTGSALGIMGTLAVGSVPPAEAAPSKGKPLTAAGMARDKKNATPVELDPSARAYLTASPSRSTKG